MSNEVASTGWIHYRARPAVVLEPCGTPRPLTLSRFVLGSVLVHGLTVVAMVTSPRVKPAQVPQQTQLRMIALSDVPAAVVPPEQAPTVVPLPGAALLPHRAPTPGARPPAEVPSPTRERADAPEPEEILTAQGDENSASEPFEAPREPVPQETKAAASGANRGAPAVASAGLGKALGNGQGPQAVYSPAPAYPREARLARQTGRVRIRILISDAGIVRVAVIEQSSGVAVLDEAARNCARRWRFTPTVVGGHAVSTWAVIPFAFSLR